MNEGFRPEDANARRFWPTLAAVARGRGPEASGMAALGSDSEEDLVSYGTGLEPLEEGEDFWRNHLGGP
jgi:hypothetical protein